MIVCILFISCKKDLNTSANNKNLAATNVSNAASTTAVTSTDKVPTQIQIFIPCANGGLGETVDLTGTLNVVFHTTINGNNFSAKYHFQPQGISGLGETTGDKYNATGVTQEHFSGSFSNGQFEDTFIDNFRIIGQGSGNNYLIHENSHVTVNANGQVTVVIDNFTADCK